MAKWGEGDPRWIVEERPDATNVNNWHWNEKNATPWSKERFLHLFKDFSIDDANIKCTIYELEKSSGEASVNNRKGKLIFFYEWDLLLKWKGCLLNSTTSEYTGKISIPNLSEENELKDIEITISIDESNDTSEILKQFMYNVGREKIRKILGVYITELKEEYSKNLILPIKDDTVASKGGKCERALQYNNNDQTKSEITLLPPVGCKLDGRTIHIEEDFQCSARDLYNVLVKQSMVEAFTRGPAVVDAYPGGKFYLYGGHVHGFFEELVPEKKIKLRWRLKSWPSEHYSEVVIEMVEMKNGCCQKSFQFLKRIGNFYQPLFFRCYFLENLIGQQMCDYLLRKNLLSAKKSGYMKTESYTTPLLDVLGDLRSKMYANMVAFLFPLNHSKGYYSVDFEILTKPLPQSSVLWSLLFCMCIDNLPDISNNSKVHIRGLHRKNSTTMKLRQSGVPALEYDVVKSNWYRYYWHSIKQTFGFGVALSDVL